MADAGFARGEGADYSERSVWVGIDVEGSKPPEVENLLSIFIQKMGQKTYRIQMTIDNSSICVRGRHSH